MPLAPAKTVAERFPEHLEAVLNALGTDPRFVAAEVAASTGARWAKTANRSVVGIMNEFTYLAEADCAREHSDDLVSIAVRLAGTPCSPLYKRHSFPDRELAALVASPCPTSNGSSNGPGGMRCDGGSRGGTDWLDDGVNALVTAL